MEKLDGSIWKNKLWVNTEVANRISDILAALQNKPENAWKDKFQILKDFLDYYKIEWGSLLIEEMNNNKKINFDMVKDDGFDIGQIIWDNKDTSSSTLHNILNNDSFGPIWKEIEKVVISTLIKKVRDILPHKLKNKFNEEVDRPGSLNRLKDRVWDFFEYAWIDEEKKNEIKKIKITNKDIVDLLVKHRKLEEWDIKWNYNNWNPEYRKSFDMLITQEYLWWLKDSANHVEKKLDIAKNSFTSLVPKMSWITDKYPYDIKEIKQQNPALAKNINLYQRRLANWEDVRKEFDNACFEAYTWLVKSKNLKLWDILFKLFQNKFDFSKLDKEEQNELLHESVKSRVEEYKKEWLSELIGIDENNLDNFIKDLFDLDKKEITIPCAWWEIKLSVHKKIKWGEHPSLVDFGNFAEYKVPFEFFIQTSWENSELINKSGLKHLFTCETSNNGKFIHLDWDSIGKLLLMYSLWLKSFDKKDMAQGNASKLEKAFGIIDKEIELKTPQEENDQYRDGLVYDETTPEDKENSKRKRNYPADAKEIKENINIKDDKIRINKSKEKINLEWKIYNDPEETFGENDPKAKAIIAAHYSTVYKNIDEVPTELKNKVKLIDGLYYEIGSDWKKVAWLKNYTDSQIKKKIKILKDSWFNSWHVKILLQDWFCGIDPEAIEGTPIAEHVDSTPEKKKNKEALLDAREKFKNEEEPKQKSWANFLNYLKENEWQSEGDYFWYKWTDMEVEGDNLIVKWNDEEKNEIEDTREEDKPKESIESKENDFMTAWKNIKWFEFPDDKKDFGFVEDTTLWVKFGETELPPSDIWWDQWIQLKITNITEKTFKLKLSWWELSAGSMEWKEISYPKTKDSLNTITSAFNGDVYKLPKSKERDKTLWSVKSGWLPNLNWIDVFDGFKYDKWKFISSIERDEKDNWKEITHFWTDEKTYDESGNEKRKPVFYKITHNNNWTVTLEYENYKREMDYNNFIIFAATKSLKPATKDHVEETIKNYDNEAKAWLGRKKIEFFSISNIFGAVKWVGKKINESIKKYNDERTDAFNEFLVSDVQIFKKLTAVTSFIPWVWNALQWVELDYYNERDSKIRKKIDKRLKIFEADTDFWDTFSQPWYLKPYLWWSSLEQMVTDCKMPKDPYIAAAALLALISKWKSPYRSIPWLKMQWARVKLLLWEWHQKRFKEHQADLIREIENTKWRYGSSYDAQMTNDLVKAEMSYLINNIWWRSTWQRFGQMPWDNDPKLKWSDAFAWKLDEKYSEWSTQSKVEDAYNWIKNVTNFTFAYNEFKRFSTSGRSPNSLAFLKKMATLAKSPQQISILKMSILGWMLNWFFLNFADKDTKGRLESICRSIWFAPWLWITRYDQKENTKYALDYISKWDFSKKTKYNPNNFWADAGKIDYKWFMAEFEKWWNSAGASDVQGKKKTNWTEVSDFLRKLPKAEITDNDAIMTSLKWLSIESQVEWTDNDVDTNSKIITDSPLSQTKGLVQQKMMKYENWAFSWEIDKIQAAEDFWNEVSKTLADWVKSKNELKSVMNIYLNRFDNTFDESSKADLVRRISTVRWYKKQMVWWVVKQEGWNIRQTDLDNIMRYSTVWEIVENGRSAPPAQLKSVLEAFYKIFEDNIDSFDDNMISDIFGRQYLEDFNRPYYMAPWDEYIQTVENFSSQYLSDEEREAAEEESIRKLTPAQKALRDNKKRDYKNEDIFLNKKLRDLEKRLSRKWLQWAHPLWTSSRDIDRSKERLGNK